MEGLVLLVFEALAALLVPVFLILSAAAALIISLIASLAYMSFQAVRRSNSPLTSLPAPKAIQPGAPPLAAMLPARPRRWPLFLALGSVTILVAGWVLLEFVFFQPIIRRAANRIARKSGIELSFKESRGSLLTGHIVLSGVSARRTGTDRDTFDLQLEDLEIDARWRNLFGGERSLTKISLRGIRGQYDRLGGQEHQPRKPFTADLLELADCKVDWILHRAGKPDLKIPIEIDQLRVAPFQSTNAAFCVLFRGDGVGKIAGSPWKISGEGTGYGRHTEWTADAVPVELLAGFFGEPFDWLESGTVEVHVKDAWHSGERTEVDLRWRLVFHDLRIAVPSRIEGLKRRLGDALVGLANHHPKELPLEFTMTLDENGLKGRMSLETLELWDALAAGLIDELAARSGLGAETIRELGRAGWAKLKGWLEKRAAGKH